MNPEFSKAEALASLRRRIRECARCPLHRGRTQGVPGAGPADAEVMFVGEAPGRQEDLKGEPFVGGSGRVFDDLLKAIGLARADVYITNVVKSRPVVGSHPGHNRPPTPDEIAACAPYLAEEVRIIKPKLVVTLGQLALDQFLPRRKLAEVHGRVQSADEMLVLPLYHPAMARFPKWRAIVKRDFRKIPMAIRKTEEHAQERRTLEPRT